MPDPRYDGLDLERIKAMLTPDDYAVFLGTVGAIEIPLAWTERGKPIYAPYPNATAGAPPAD